MGSSQKGILRGRMRHGFGQYFMGTDLLYMTVSSIFRFAHPPYVIGGAAMWWGYVESALKGAARYPDTDFRKFLRRYQRRCLLVGKARATRELDQEASSRMRPAKPESKPPQSLLPLVLLFVGILFLTNGCGTPYKEGVYKRNPQLDRQVLEKGLKPGEFFTTELNTTFETIRHRQRGSQRVGKDRE